MSASLHNDALLAAADRRDCLPLKRKEGNSKDRLLNDVLHHLRENGMGFHPTLSMERATTSYKRLLTLSGTWIHTKWAFVSECVSRHGLSAIPARWRQVFSATTYNDWQAKLKAKTTSPQQKCSRSARKSVAISRSEADHCRQRVENHA